MRDGMKFTTLFTRIIVLTLGLWVLTCCSGSSDAREATVKFDGETVTYDGPEAISAGEMKITLENSTDMDLDILVVKMDDGKTWQELLDYIGEPGGKVPPPPWVENTTLVGVPDEPDASAYVLKQGTHGIILCSCNEILDYQVWPVAPLEVKDE